MGQQARVDSGPSKPPAPGQARPWRGRSSWFVLELGSGLSGLAP